MYNSDSPARAELPSSRQLMRSTVLAAVAALVLLGTVVLPAEYGIDPTGVGRVLGLTDMGLTKMRLAAEAARADAPAPASKVTAPDDAPTPPVRTQAAVPPAMVASAVADATPLGDAWRHEMKVLLLPGQGAEIKMHMRKGDKARYDWSVEGGVVNHDTHADGEGRTVSYAKGRGVPADHGELVAAFNGKHGWFWRNRGQAPVTLTLRTRGTYALLEWL